MHNKRLALSVLLLCGLCAFASGIFAQSAEDWYYDKEIRDIKFIGLKSVKPLDLDAIVSGFLGQKFSDTLYADVLNKIYALDYFEDISPVVLPADAQRQTIVLQFTVKERPIIKALVFTGNKQVRTSELRTAVAVKEKDIYVANKILLDERKLRDLYLQKGYTNVSILSDIKEEPDGVTVTFNMTEGKATVITAIKFQGNSLASEKTLKKDLKLKELSLLQKGAFQEATLEADKQTLLLYYQNKGYIDAIITDLVRETTYNAEKDRDEMTITYVIKEGDQYLYGGTSIEGNKIFTTEELLALIKIKEGAVFNQTRFQEGLMALADLYYENGYTSNGFMPDIKKNAETRLVSCALSITERPRSHIENIIIVGNKKTKTKVILREIPLEPGDIFSKAKMTRGLRGLYNLSFFSAIVPEIVQGSEENLVDVILNVEERSTTAIEFGITFSGITDPSAWPVSLFAKWSDINFLGSGKSIAAEIKGSNEEQSLSFNYGDPWFLGKPLNFSAGFNIKHMLATTRYYNYGSVPPNVNDFYMNYNQLSFGLNFALGKRWVRNFAVITATGGITNTFARNFYNPALYEPVDKTVSAKEGKFGVQNSIWIKAALDARDLNFDPSKGWFVSQQLTWTGLIPKVETEYFLRSDTKGEIYFTLLDHPVSETWNLKFVLAAYTGFTFLVPAKDGLIGNASKLYIDGMFNGRGWDSLQDNRGVAMWSSFVELRMPVAPGIFSIDFFMDTVAISESLPRMFTGIKDKDFYFSFGPGIRFSLPQFPLRLLWSWPFKFENGVFQWGPTGNKGKFVLSFSITNQ